MPHTVASPGAFIGASNFFELAVAGAITLFGPGSGAALGPVVSALVEVPVMLSVCTSCNRPRGWYQRLDLDGSASYTPRLLRPERFPESYRSRQILRPFSESFVFTSET